VHLDAELFCVLSFFPPGLRIIGHQTIRPIRDINSESTCNSMLFRPSTTRAEYWENSISSLDLAIRLCFCDGTHEEHTIHHGHLQSRYTSLRNRRNAFILLLSFVMKCERWTDKGWHSRKSVLLVRRGTRLAWHKSVEPTMLVIFSISEPTRCLFWWRRNRPKMRPESLVPDHVARQ